MQCRINIVLPKYFYKSTYFLQYINEEENPFTVQWKISVQMFKFGNKVSTLEKSQTRVHKKQTEDRMLENISERNFKFFSITQAKFNKYQTKTKEKLQNLISQ